MPHNQLKVFFEKHAESLQKTECIKKSFEILDKYPLLPSQALYVNDWRALNIPYQRGIKKLLGYSFEEFNQYLLLEFIHPDDIEQYLRFMKISTEWAWKIKPEPFTVESLLDYRVKKKDGTYLKILRQSTIFENCRDKSIKSTLSILTDISNIKFNNAVNLQIITLDDGKIVLQDTESNSAIRPNFTVREREILQKIKLGHNSKAIAEQLCISRHTVDTHRRKMLAKTECKNVVELVQEATMHGII